MKKAFTFIELLIVVTIMIIFSVLLLASYNNFTERKRLEAEGKKIVDVLELAKKKSISRDLSPDSDFICAEFGGYSVDFFSSTSYRLIYHCEAVESTVKYYVLDKNLTVSPVEEIQFNPYLGVTNEAGSIIIILANSLTDKCVNITIYTSGVIEEGSIVDCT